MFPDLQTLPDEDFREGVEPPAPPDPADAGFRTEPDLPLCQECGRPIPWKGRGRKPLRHPECKKSGSSTGTRKPRSQTAQLVDPIDELVGTLQDGLGQLAGGMSGLAPVTAGTMLLTGPRAIDAMVRIASRYPRVLAAFQKAAEAVPYFDIARFAGGVVAAIGVDTGRLLPEGMMMEYLEVAEAARQVGYVPPEQRSPTATPVPRDESGMRQPPPPRFIMD